MNTRIIGIVSSSLMVLLLSLGFTVNYQDNFGITKIFAQEKPPVAKSSQLLQLSGKNFGDVADSKDISLKDYTISVWFNTASNVTDDEPYLINKGGKGSEKAGSNLNYGIWLTNREKVRGGFETGIGEDYTVTSPASFSDGKWHHTALTFDQKAHTLKLYVDGLEVATNSTKSGVSPDTTGKQIIRIGANSLAEKGKVNGNFTGQIDDVQIWDIPFSNVQITDLFKRETATPRQ